MDVSTGRLLLAVSVTLAQALVLGACGSDRAKESAGSLDGIPAQATKAAAADDRTDGTLRLGERTFAFRVMTACDLGDAEIESPDETLRGTGTTEDGTRFTVVVDRGSVGLGLIHTVSVTYGDLMAGTGYRAAAMRTGSGAGWSDEGGTYDQPLIRIDGRTVRAAGRFEVDDAGAESAVEGRLEVTCPA